MTRNQSFVLVRLPPVLQAWLPNECLQMATRVVLRRLIDEAESRCSAVTYTHDRRFRNRRRIEHCSISQPETAWRARNSINQSINQSFICLNTDITEKTPQINSEIVTNRTPGQENLQ